VIPNGILLVDKPEGITSHDVVNEVRKKLCVRKVGHAGTLDPFATGLLIIGVGNGTRVLEYLMNHEKVYRVKMRLGIITETFDITGEIVEKRPVNVTESQIIEVLKSFTGTYKQVPPAYSARKYKGEKLYELARKGKIIRLPPREVTVYEIKDISVEGCDISFTAKVSPGTYIRSLCMDVGYALNCGAVAVELRRLSTGSFSVDEAIDVFKIDELEILKHLRKLSSILDFPKVILKREALGKAFNGAKIKVSDIEKFEEFEKNSLVQVIFNNELICIARTERKSSFIRTLMKKEADENLLKPLKVFRGNLT